MLEQKIKNSIRDVHDFPKKGILFKDITPVFQDQQLCSEIITEFEKLISTNKIDAIVGIESRGFILGFALANKLNVPFIMARKAGKLPYKTISYEYELEYGSAKIEMQLDDIKPGWNVLIHDDLLATGGTAEAVAELIKMQKGNVAAFTFLIELKFLAGAERLKKHSDKIISVIGY